MSKFKSGLSKSSSSSSPRRRQPVPEEQSSLCSTSHFHPDATYGDYNDTTHFGPGSLAAMSPTSRGHTMKECEEQLSQLQKENFNLKLRIYFLEERLGHRGQPAPGTEAATWEATLRAEMEALRIELADKQQLLCQAASAIDLVEKKHSEEVDNLKADARTEKLALEEQLTQLHQASNERCKELQDEMSRVSAQCRSQQEELAAVTAQCQQQVEQLRRRCDAVSVATQSVEPAVDHTSAAVREHEVRIDQLVQELQLKGQQVMDAEQRIKGLEEALCEKQPEIQIKIQELRERDSIIEEKQNQIEQQNKVLVEIQITLAEKQRLIDALNSTIASRDAKVVQLEAQLVEARSRIQAGETRLQEEGHELSRVKSENEMLKTQLKRMNRSKEERESPRRRSNLHSRDSLSPRKKSVIEEAIEGIWNAPVLRTRDEFTPLKEKENHWKLNEAKEKTEKVQQLVDSENKLEKKSDRFSEENYLKLEREHQRGCEAIQGFITRIKHLTNENDHLRRESKRGEKKLSVLQLEIKELRDLYNKAKWEARQLQAEAMGVPGTGSTLADVKDMTEEENERLWAEVEDKNRKLAQVSLEMEQQVQALLTSLKDKESQLLENEKKLTTSEDDLHTRKQRIKELEEIVKQLQSHAHSSAVTEPLTSITDNSQSLDIQHGLPRNILNDLEVGLRQSVLNLRNIIDINLWNNDTIDDLQECLNIIFKKREMEISSLKHQVKFRDLQLKLFAEKMTELGASRPLPSGNSEYNPVNYTHHLQKPVANTSEHSLLSDVTCRGVLLTLEQQLVCSRNDQTNLRCEVESLRKQLHHCPEQDGDGRSLTVLAMECNKLREDIFAAEVWKKNATNACNLLVGRLEELAGFLVSLLRHPERLGNLETNHCQFIKQAVQRSINLSRQLSMSISHQEETDCSVQAGNSLLLESMPNMNFSLVGQYLDEFNETNSKLNDLPFASCSTNTLDKLCGINESEAERTQDIDITLENESVTHKTDEQAGVIARLRAQVDTLKLEIKQRDIELNCLMQEHHLIKLSSPLFDLKDSAYDHPLASITFYNKQHTANKSSQLSLGTSSKSVETKEITVAAERCGNNEYGSENSIDHIILPEPICTNSDDTVHHQTASNGKHGRSGFGGNVTSRTQHDAVALSESETWSEPDRQISLARIGLPEESACLGLAISTSYRHHHSRNLQELDESSESSQETTREISRTSGKRRSDTMEMRRLHARLRGLEQVNDALRTELAILHQITPVTNLSPCPESPTNIDVNKKVSSDGSSNSKIIQTDDNLLACHSQQLENPVVIPSHLLEQIKNQREKLESSLFHNDFIRRQLEEVFLSATGHSSGDKVDERKTLLKIDGATEKLEEAQSIVSVIQAKLQAAENKAKELETKLQETERLTLANRDQGAKVAEAQKQCREAQEMLLVLQDKVKALEKQLQEKDDEIEVKINLVAELKEKVLTQSMDINKIIQEMSDLKLESEKRELQAEERVKKINNKLLNKVEEIEKDVLLAEKRRKFTEQELKEAKENLTEAMMQKIEANKIIDMMKIEFSSKMHLCEEAQKCLELEIEQRNIESNKEMDRRSKKLEEAEKQLEELRWVYKAEVERKVKDAEKFGIDIEAGLRRQIEVAEKRTKEVEEICRAREADLRKQVQESEKRFLDQVVSLRQQQDEAMLAASKAALERTKLVNEKLCLEQEVRNLESREMELTQEHCAAERRHLAIQEQLNNQILILQQQKSELEQRVQDLESANAELRLHLDQLSHMKEGSYHSTSSSRRTVSPPAHGHLRPEASMFPREGSYFSGRGWSSEGRARSPDSNRSPLSSLVLQRGFGRQHSDFSDYVSEDQEYETIVTQSCSSYWITTMTGCRSDACNTPTGVETPLGRNINSPDLGIESDQGRFSSLEANVAPVPSDHGLVERCSAPELHNSHSAVQKFRGGRSDHNCKEIAEKNIKLKRELCQTRRALEDTLAQLTASNQRKQKVEEAICRQLQKTHSILMKTRGNLQHEHLMLQDDQL